jgi:DnaD/phage-associated family protein
VENTFLCEYMPGACDLCVKVYLYGLFLCTAAGSDNDADEMARRLSLEPQDILNAYTYWQELGLVLIERTSPLEVRYQPLRHAAAYKKYKPGKYADFNRQIQDILADRMITPNEFNKYYETVEELHIEPEALLMVAKYCANLKGTDIGYAYILTVARNWASDGVTTVAHVEERLLQYDGVAENVKKVLKALKTKRAPDIDDRQLYIKWTTTMGFDLPAILYAASNVTVRGGIDRVDKKLTRYYEGHISTKDEMQTFEENRDTVFSLARKIARTLGVFYEQIDTFAESFVAAWLQKGYEEDALLLIAQGCFMRGLKTPEAVGGFIDSLYKQGIVTYAQLMQQMATLSAAGAQIKAVFAAAGIDKTVTARDRDAYRTWTYAWGLPDEVILHAAALSKGTAAPWAYLSKVLSAWHEKGITTLAAAKTEGGNAGNNAAPAGDVGIRFSATRQYTAEDLTALIDDAKDIVW